jgi:hypothetical protein
LKAGRKESLSEDAKIRMIKTYEKEVKVGNITMTQLGKRFGMTPSGLRYVLEREGKYVKYEKEILS